MCFQAVGRKTNPALLEKTPLFFFNLHSDWRRQLYITLTPVQIDLILNVIETCMIFYIGKYLANEAS